MRPSTPDELADAPELASLEGVTAAAAICRRSLLAVHPELTCGDFLVQHPEVTPRECLAAAVIAALDALADTVENYSAHVEVLATLRTCTSSESDKGSY